MSFQVATPGGWDAGGGNYIGLVDASYVPQSGSCNSWGCVGLTNGIAGVLGISGSNGVPVHAFSLTMGTWCEFLACGLRAWGYDPSLSDSQGAATIPFAQTQGHTIQGGPGAVGLRHLQEWDTSIFQSSANGYHIITVAFDAYGTMNFAVDGTSLAQLNASIWLPANATLVIGGSQPVQGVQLTFNCSASLFLSTPNSPPPPLPPTPSPPSPVVVVPGNTTSNASLCSGWQWWPACPPGYGCQNSILYQVSGDWNNGPNPSSWLGLPIPLCSGSLAVGSCCSLQAPQGNWPWILSLDANLYAGAYVISNYFYNPYASGGCSAANACSGCTTSFFASVNGTCTSSSSIILLG